MSSKKKKRFSIEKGERVSKAKRIKSIKTLITKGMINIAYNEVERYLADYPKDSYGLYQRATINGILGNVEEEKQDLKYIIENSLESKYSARYKLASIYLSEGNNDMAEKLLIENINKSPYPETYSIIALSNIKLLKGEQYEALKVLNRYANMDDDEIVIQEAVVENKLKYTRLAYDKLINHKFSDNDIIMTKYYNTRAVLAGILGNFDEAKECYQECFKRMNLIQKDRIEIDYASGCYSWGDFEEARRICMRIVYDPNSEYKEKAYSILGNICKMKEDYDDARNYYLEAVKNQRFPMYRGYILIAQTYSLEGNFEEAKKYYDLVAEKSINKQIVSESYIRLAFLELRKNNIEGVKKYESLIDRKYVSVLDTSDYAFLKIIIDHIDGINNIEEGYTYSQFKEYDYTYDRLLNHISKEHEGNGITAFFSPSIDMSSFVLEVADIIRNQKPISNYTMDVYRITYENVGYVEDKLVNQCEVVTFPGSDKILTVYPCFYCSMDNMKEEKKVQKQKSRIDKFNQRYGIEGN